VSGIRPVYSVRDLPGLYLSQTPTPHGTLLKTKAKPQFDRAVDRAVEAFFRVFLSPNHVVSAMPSPGQIV